MTRKTVPAYRLHKPSGQARAIVGGRHVYLGKFNSAESRQKYARLLAERSQPSHPGGTTATPPTATLLLVAEVLVKHLEFAEDYYDADGTPGKEFRAMVDAIAPVNDFYGDSLADEFGPLKLKAVRQHLIDRDLCRTEINKRIGRIKCVFKWAVSEQIVTPTVHEGLRTVTANGGQNGI